MQGQLLSRPERSSVTDNFLNLQFYSWQASRYLHSSVAVPSAASLTSACRNLLQGQTGNRKRGSDPADDSSQYRICSEPVLVLVLLSGPF